MVKGLLMLSGGIDSPVAGWLVKRAGFEVGAINFSRSPLFKESDKKRRRISLISKTLGFSPLMRAEFGRVLRIVRQKGVLKYYFLVARVLMHRVAERVALEGGYSFLIDGENLGQVASQTLTNILMTQSSIAIPLFRPLLCFEKQDTIRLSKKIGVYELSLGPEECSSIGPKHPATSSDIALINEQIDALNPLLDEELSRVYSSLKVEKE